MIACDTCGRLFDPPHGVVNKKTCSPECVRMKRSMRDREIYAPQRAYRNKLAPKRPKAFKLKDSLDLPPPSRRERESMMDGLYRLALSTSDEITLLFGQAQDLGRGLHYKQTEVRL